MGLVQPEPMHISSPNFHGLFDPRGSRDDEVLGISSNHCCHDNASKVFSFLKFVGVLQLEPMHTFLPHFHGMFNRRGARDDKVFGHTEHWLLSWQHFYKFSVLKFLGVLQPEPMH